MNWIYFVIVLVVSAAGSYYAQRRASSGASMAPGQQEAPTAAEGRKIGKLFGTRRLYAPCVVYYGNTRTEAIQK